MSLENAGDKAIDTGFRLVEGFDENPRQRATHDVADIVRTDVDARERHQNCR